MSSWSNTDAAVAAPCRAKHTSKKHQKQANRTDLFGDTTANNFIYRGYYGSF